jgi:quinol monooxygenase YgiN
MSQTGAVAKLTAVDGKAEDLKAVIADLVAAVRDGEAGTLVYAAAQDTDDPNVFWFYELYESGDAASAHATGEALAAVGPRMRGLIVGRPEVHRLVPIAAKGLPG